MRPLLAAEHWPNEEALALAPTIGWLLLLCVGFAVAVVLLDIERFRRFWLRTEDPRAIATFRIAFASVLLLNINNMWPHFEYLFTDEGLFMTDSARQYIAGAQFKGYGEGLAGEDTGFFDVHAVLTWAKGPRYSLLHFWSSPRFFWWYIAAFEVTTIAFLLGFRTRLSGLLSFLLTLGLMGRSPVYQSGADGVFRVMFVYLVLARSGHAYSIDNWLRCRRLRRDAKLDDRDGPGEGAGSDGLEAIYRRIPAWPRTLMVLQLATIYLWTGCAKTGDVWWKGDSLYYALNLDHFSRIPTAYFGYVFGTNLFRVMTWTVHYWQIGFGLMVMGLIVRWALREKLSPPDGWRGWALRASWVGLGLGALAITWVGLPVHYPADKTTPIRTVQIATAVGWVTVMAVVGWGWWRLRDRPFEFTIRGRAFRIDLETFCSYALGRKLWLTLGMVFHLHILVLMNIGMFAPVMLVAYIACLNGTEIATIFRRIGMALARIGVPFIPAWVAAGERITPTERRDPARSNQHGDGRRVPVGVLIACVAFVVAAILAKLDGAGRWWWLGLIGVGMPLAYAVFDRVRLGAPRPDPEIDGSGILAYGPIGRAFVASFLTLQLGAVAGWCIPDKDCTRSFRPAVRDVVRPWLHVTQTYQSWNMFAPNPTRTNVFMKVFVTDDNGEIWDLYTDANSPRNKVQPWFVYDRMGKITRRVTGKGKHYRKWVARYHCRQWALEHGGVVPEQVQILKQWYAVPSPEKIRKLGPYDPDAYLAERGRQKVIYTAKCATEPDAQLTNEQRLRHGLPTVDESQIHRAVRPHQVRWEAKQHVRVASGLRKAKLELRRQRVAARRSRQRSR